MGLNVEGKVFEVGSMWFVWNFVLGYVDGLVVVSKNFCKRRPIEISK